MKKILSIIAAGSLALLALSCVKEERAVVDFTNATPPALQSVEVGNDIVIQYTPADFHMDFNKQMKTYHVAALVSIGGNASNVNLSSKNDGNQIVVSGKNLTNALRNRGYQTFDLVPVEIVVRGSIQDPSRGITNGFVDSKEKFSFTWEIPEEAQGSPYEEYTEDSPWSLIGKMAAYEIDWNHDLNMWTDGNGNHVAAHVNLKAGDEVKFRKDQDWAVNFGGDMSAVGSEFEVTQGGPNIVIGVDGYYDLFLNENGSAIVAEAYDPYPDFTEASTWSIIGKLNAYEADWNKDLPMVTDGTTHVAYSVSIMAADEFKFRKDADWAVNFGGDFASLDSDFEVTQGGPNIIVGADGVYDLFLNPDAGTAKVATPSGMKVSSIIGGDEPEPEPEPVIVTGWNIIGLNGDWDNDVLAKGADGIWTAYITAENDTEFKWRKDAAWEENYGGAFAAFGEPFAAVAGGDNIPVPAGFYKVVLDLTDETAPTITVYNDFVVWSLIGDFNGWDGDVDMVETDGKWVAEDVQLTPGWKLRKNHGWDDNRGGVFEELGKAFAVTAGGDNIDCGTGKFTVVYDPEAETVTVTEGTVWSLIGEFNGWAGDVDMVETDGLWVAEGVDLIPGWKIRKNHDWPENRGGVFVAYGEPFAVVNNGDNIDCGTGKFTVTYNPAEETITVTPATYGWSLIGVNGDWDNDIDMLEAAPGIWISPEVEITSAGWKVRYDHGWDVNRGGATPEHEGEFVKAVPGGDNINLTGKFKVVYNANNGTIGTLVWGVVGSIAGIPGFSWNNDIPMNLATDGKWYSIPVTLAEGDEIKIRKYAGWDENFGGTFAEANVAFEAVAGGDNIKAEGTYQVIYDPEAETLTLSKLYWGIVGEFSGWGGQPDVYMLPLGDGKWAAYGQSIAGPWKVRQGSDWDVNRGGTFVERGTAFEAVAGGDNITIADEKAFDVIYDATAETITVE